MFRPVTAAAALLLFASHGPSAEPANAVRLGKTIVVPSRQEVRNAICLLCSIRLDGDARGNLVSFAGNINLNGNVHRDVVVLGGSVTLGGASRINGVLIVFGGRLHRQPGAVIGRRCIVLRPIIFLPILLVVAAVIAALIFLLRLLTPREAFRYPPLPRL